MNLKAKILKKPLIFLVLISIALSLFAIIFSALSFSKLPDEIILQLNNNEGVKTFGSRADFIGVVVSVIILICVNFILAEVLFQRERVLSIILIFANIAISLGLVIIVSLLLSLN